MFCVVRYDFIYLFIYWLCYCCFLIFWGVNGTTNKDKMAQHKCNNSNNNSDQFNTYEYDFGFVFFRKLVTKAFSSVSFARFLLVRVFRLLEIHRCSVARFLDVKWVKFSRGRVRRERKMSEGIGKYAHENLNN